MTPSFKSGFVNSLSFFLRNTKHGGVFVISSLMFFTKDIVISFFYNSKGITSIPIFHFSLVHSLWSVWIKLFFFITFPESDPFYIFLHGLVDNRLNNFSISKYNFSISCSLINNNGIIECPPFSVVASFVFVLPKMNLFYFSNLAKEFQEESFVNRLKEVSNIDGLVWWNVD
jgi:hypothetical protein